MLERDLQKQCLNWVKQLRKDNFPILAINQHGSAFTPRGVSDIILCIGGKFVAIELTVKPNKPTDLQENFIKKVISAYGYGYVCYTLDQFKEIVFEHLLAKVGQNHG